MPRNYSSLVTFLSLTVKAHVHSVTRSQLNLKVRIGDCTLNVRCTYVSVRCESWNTHTCTSSVQSPKRTISWIGHSVTFKVIFIDVGRNPERGVDVTYNLSTVFLRPEICKFVDFNHPTQVSPQSEKTCRISTNSLYCQKLESLSYMFAAITSVYVYYFSRIL